MLSKKSTLVMFVGLLFSGASMVTADVQEDVVAKSIVHVASVNQVLAEQVTQAQDVIDEVEQVADAIAEETEEVAV